MLAVPGSVLGEVLHRSAAVLDGQLLLDSTNRMGRSTFHQLPLVEHVVPRARLYRAFCCYGWDVFANPVLDGVRADLPFCGPGGVAASAGDLGTVEKLITDVGLNPLWIGGLEAADTLDGVLRLWYSLAVDRNLGRRLAFRALCG
jgi:predicted dinucleotide-binding enzyme